MIPVSTAKNIYNQLLQWEQSFKRPAYSKHIGRKYEGELWVMFDQELEQFEVFTKAWYMDAEKGQPKQGYSNLHNAMYSVLTVTQNEVLWSFIPFKFWPNNAAITFLQAFTGSKNVYLTWDNEDSPPVLTLFGRHYRAPYPAPFSLTHSDRVPLKTIGLRKAAELTDAFYAHMRVVALPYVLLQDNLELKNFTPTPKYPGPIDETLRDVIIAHATGQPFDMVGLLQAYFVKTRTKVRDNTGITNGFLNNSRLRKIAQNLLAHHEVLK